MRRDARRSSSNSCGPGPRPSRASTRRHDAAVRSGRNAARSDRSPPRTQSTTDQGLRYEPRRPRHIQMSSQTPNNAAVTAPTSADTPVISNPDLGGSGAGAVANGSAVGLGAPAWGFPTGSFRVDHGRYRFRFQPPPVKPCMRFSRTRLTDVLHRRRSGFQARNGLGGTTIPSRLIRPRWLGELSTWVIPQPRARRRLPRLDSHSASRVKA